MESRRLDELKRICKEVEEGRNTESMNYGDSISGETSAVYIKRFGRNLEDVQKAVEELKEKGFMVIYPAELSEEKLSQMSEDERKAYKIQQESALIVDGHEDYLTPELAERISDHYYMCYDYDARDQAMGSDSSLITIDPRNSRKVTIDLYYKGDMLKAGGIKEGEDKRLSEIFKELGYTTQEQADHTTIESGFPYHAYEEHSKLRQMANDRYVKGKKKTIEGLRAARAAKEQQQEKASEEYEK